MGRGAYCGLNLSKFLGLSAAVLFPAFVAAFAASHAGAWAFRSIRQPFGYISLFSNARPANPQTLLRHLCSTKNSILFNNFPKKTFTSQ